MGTVYLHVGTMKSGTTFIQRVLDRHREALARQGIAWFGTSVTNPAVQDLLAGPMQMPGTEGSWQRLARSIRDHDGDAVVSMELLGPAPPRVRARLADSLRPHDLHVVVTMRDITRIAVSHWQEATQNRSQLGWGEFAERISSSAHVPPGERGRSFWRHHDVPALLTRYADIVDPARMTVVPVPITRGDASVTWTRFASVLGAEGVGRVPNDGRNESLGAASAELMIRVNARTEDLDWAHYRRGVKGPLAKRTLGNRVADEPRYGLDPVQHAVLRDKALAMVDAIANSAATVVGDLTDVVPPEHPADASFTTDDLTDGMMLDAALDGLSGLAQMASDLRLERDELRVRVAELETSAVTTETSDSSPSGRRARVLLRRIPGAPEAVRRLRRMRSGPGSHTADR